MYRLAREVGASRLGATISGLTWGLHGQMMVYVGGGWLPHVLPMSLAPGVIWLVCKAFRSTHAWPGRSIVAVAVLLGWQCISGHPEFVRYTLAVIAILTLAG